MILKGSVFTDLTTGTDQMANAMLFSRIRRLLKKLYKTSRFSSANKAWTTPSQPEGKTLGLKGDLEGFQLWKEQMKNDLLMAKLSEGTRPS